MEVSFSSKSGRPIQEVLIDIPGLMEVPEEDLRLAGETVRSNILARTAKGVDVKGSQFADYNSTRPYYYNPSRAAAAKRTARFGVPLRRFTRKSEVTSAARLVRKLREAGSTGHSREAGSASIRFESYKAFKQAFGRANVDLRGVQAPNMLDAIEVIPEKDQVRIGIYNPAAQKIAKGHTTDNRPRGMPLRQFFGMSTDDRDEVREMLKAKLLERVLHR